MKFEKSRFHIDFGPVSLFERVNFKMKDTHTLSFTTHCMNRCIERNIPKNIIEEIKKFNTQNWKLVTSEVRNDKGKFINSTWEKVIHEKKYWITIGFNDVVQTVVIKDGKGTDKAIRNGELYNFVDKVNKELMLQEI
ncbi:hypothetical protein [Romboutsia sp. 1001216sp1]|uniref:hypothetical protein n=1 Tax=Romboutsia sp. 1001216sp1 TaxID=2986997 RepID=UPI00232DE130|nr:hypothetical protein [Romboutsia sp. 1001216sp1]MDB8804803.1 hypothetical protein [Romboutsia sp. 1001216sp1]MDB8808118.1 hypothetical protein [Romboutsia sp. 1001216sp1]MDB8810449.1 hypothetical protein [Romboutsia sp. 1001216sp1]MDB8816168.1 hypothetical protein [Romboutsia sp. 1001216sp1]MDB8818878.1 hypothetical protein [Romboutsia sp. 1001216sp1]